MKVICKHSLKGVCIVTMKSIFRETGIRQSAAKCLFCENKIDNGSETRR